MANVIVLNQLELMYNLEENFKINALQTLNYIDRLKIIDKLPFNKGTLYFSDDTWDFRQYTSLNIPPSTLKFNFDLSPDEFKDDIKSYVLIKILENDNKIQSIYRKFKDICNFFRFLFENNVFSIHEVTVSMINKFLDEKKSLAQKTIGLFKTSVLDFYEFYSVNYKNLLTNEIRTILEESDNEALQEVYEENKYKDIPSDYFNRLIKHLLYVIDNNKEKLEFRATACILLIISQTGLRISEVLELNIDAISEDILLNGEKKYYLEYKTWKRENKNNVYTIEKTYINDLSKKGFDSLLTFHNENRDKKATNFLYVPSRSKSLPVSTPAFNKSMFSFISYYGEQLDAIDSEDKYPNLETSKIDNKPHKELHPDAKTLTYPATPQYRVHVCTELYHKGVPLKYIKKFMGHLTSQMEGYYVRPKENQVQEDIAFSKKVIKDVVSGNINLLGSNANEFSQGIKEFLDKNNYNVAKDIDEIVETLLKTIPVRCKTGGVCIKSSPLRECSKDSMTNELYCAYGVCPNIFHFFYMAEVSYRQGKELNETITANIIRGHKKQAQKEINMLKTITIQKIIPELDELKREIDKKGVDEILFQYPDLIDIVEDFNEVYREAETWRNLK